MRKVNKIIVFTAMLMIGSIVSCGENGFSLDTSTCRVGSQKLITWDQKPTFADGYLSMRGTTKEDARIHDPVASRTGTNRPAFGLNDLNETGDDTRLDPLASIYPKAMRERIKSAGKPELYAETYNVTATSFDVRVAVPANIAAKNMVVGVWGENPGQDQRPIGAECVKK